MANGILARTTVEAGHYHNYTPKIAYDAALTYTTIADGHSHIIERDGVGNAISIAESDGHTHDLFEESTVLE